MIDRGLRANELDVLISELLVATADGCDRDMDQRITALLGELRQRMGMDVVFVSEFCDGQRVFRFVEGNAALGLRAGDAAPLEQSYCQRVVQGRLPELVTDARLMAASAELPATPFPVGAHLSTPLVLSDGRVFGTLCCFSTQPNPNLRLEDLSRLKGCARLVARRIEASEFPDTEIDPGGPPLN